MLPTSASQVSVLYALEWIPLNVSFSIYQHLLKLIGLHPPFLVQATQFFCLIIELRKAGSY